MAVAALVVDSNNAKMMWTCLAHAPLPVTSKTKFESQWVQVNKLPKIVLEPVAFPVGAKGYVLPNSEDVIADFVLTKGPKDSIFGTNLSKSKKVVPESSGEASSDEEERARRAKPGKGRGRKRNSSVGGKDRPDPKSPKLTQKDGDGGNEHDDGDDDDSGDDGGNAAVNLALNSLAANATTNAAALANSNAENIALKAANAALLTHSTAENNALKAAAAQEQTNLIKALEARLAATDASERKARDDRVDDLKATQLKSDKILEKLMSQPVRRPQEPFENHGGHAGMMQNMQSYHQLMQLQSYQLQQQQSYQQQSQLQLQQPFRQQ